MGDDSYESFLGLSFNPTIDAGMFLTFLTLITGVIAWGVKSIKEWRRDARQEAQNGALRLLLKILRERYERSKGPVDLHTLQTDFSKPERKAERQAYCGRDFRFKNEPHFEQAIYALQWEAKVDFAESDKVLWRTSRERPRYRVSVSPAVATQALQAALDDDEVSEWDLERLTRLAAGADPAATKAALETAVVAARDNPRKLRKLLLVAALAGDS